MWLTVWYIRMCAWNANLYRWIWSTSNPTTVVTCAHIHSLPYVPTYIRTSCCSYTDEISFTARRHRDCSIGISIYVDGMIDTRVSVCCEYRHKAGKHLGCKNGHFKLVRVSGGKPCIQCQLSERERGLGRLSQQKKAAMTSEKQGESEGDKSLVARAILKVSCSSVLGRSGVLTTIISVAPLAPVVATLHPTLIRICINYVNVKYVGIGYPMLLYTCIQYMYMYTLYTCRTLCA